MLSSSIVLVLASVAFASKPGDSHAWQAPTAGQPREPRIHPADKQSYKQVPGTVRHNIDVEGTHVGAGRQETSAGDISEILRKRSLTSRECRLPASPAPKPTETQLSMMRLGRVDYLPSKPPADWFRHLRQKETSGQSERERDKPMERSGTSGST
ncbi:hypothetical protein FB45DRAFT_1011281 [Roridomyces roridus]|uniref:Uncharacterized protein n=1 Tax=Roridomyces roridus TaxID=1738132 RepID=A0AAD7B172_9AGAR|nr:hypothetical protein FB45DRAFT_1011281 [Roridomyces roridus]